MRWRLVLAALLLCALLLYGAGAPININTAGVKELTTLPGIGPATAKLIVKHRQRNGPFRKVEELLIIKGISRKRLEKLRPLVTVATK
jgi:competence protein ComEA